MIDNIKKNIITNILDESYKTNSMNISFSIINNDLFVLHIYNPKNDYLVINKNNETFLKKLSNMFFNKNEKHKGCFNHQQEADSKLYTSPLDIVLNHFLGIQYSFILVETKTMNPLSISCCIDNYIYNVCTNFENRGQGNMSKLLDHFFELVKRNKLKNGNHTEILLDIVYLNPD
jgi:hypothetical protein